MYARDLTGTQRLFAVVVHIVSLLANTEISLSFLAGARKTPYLLEVYLHAEVLPHFSGSVVALCRVDVEAEIVYEGKGLVLATHGFFEAGREDGEVIHEGKKPYSRAHCAMGVGEVKFSLPLRRVA